MNNLIPILDHFSKLCDVKIHVKTEPGEYGPVEDIHMVIDHLVGAYLMYK